MKTFNYVSISLCLSLSTPLFAGPMVKCQASRSPLFQGTNPNESFGVDIIADHDTLNYKYEPVTGVIVYNYMGKLVSVGARLLPRGNSRLKCFPKPIKSEFESEATMASLARNSKDPYALYAALAELRRVTPLLKASSQKLNIFDKLGDDIKIVNPCFIKDANNSWLGAESVALQQEKLLAEFYVYKILEELGTSTLKTRLAFVTYRRPDGSISTSGYSFFREPENKAAERCNQVKDSGPNPVVYDEDSSFQLRLLFAFIGGIDYNTSGHNVAFMHVPGGKTSFIPYDFDTSTFVTPYYGGVSGDVIDRMTGNLSALLRSEAANPTAKTHVREILAKKANMVTIINKSFLSARAKQQFLIKLEYQFRVLETFGR